MTIAYCATIQPRFGGLKSFNLGLVKALDSLLSSLGHTFLLITHQNYLDDFQELSQNPIPFSGNHFLFENIRLPLLLKKINVDIAIFPHNRLPLIQAGSYKTACIFHDLLFYRYPDQFSFSKRLFRNFQMKRAAKKCQYSFSVSGFTASELTKFVPGHQSTVCYQAIPPKNQEFNRDLSDFPQIQKPYFLFIGAQSFQKNLPNLIQGFSIFKQGKPNVQLVIAGGQGTANEEVNYEISNSPFRNDIIKTGYITDAQKWSLLTNSEALVFPSIYEGFGIPLLEGFEAGVPVICSNLACLPEISNGAALEVDPAPGSLAQAMTTLFHNEKLKAELIGKGKARLKEFSWEKTASILVKSFFSIS